MTDQIAKAMAYANEGQHCGAGYTLLIHVDGGHSFEVAVFGNPNSYTLRKWMPESEIPSGGPELFIDPDRVAAVEVLW